MADELATTKQSLVLPRVSLWDIFITWFWMGLQSFGGGSSTFILIHRACISRGWQTEEEFVRTYALAQISPGINLLKLTILVTNKLRGLGGALAGLAGLMIPSGVVTVLMTAGFALIRTQPLVKAAMSGILPATIGLSLAMAVQMAQPLFKRAAHEGPARLGLHVGLLAVSAVLMGLLGVSPVLVLLLAGLIGMLLLWLIPAAAAKVEQGEAGPSEELS